jgi:parvulin-like peptidyl-prolyl isomerase
MRTSSLLLVPSALVLGGLLARGEVVERVIVKVNGDIVTQSEFVARQIQELQAARIPPDGVEAFLRENNARILQQAIDDLLLVQRAADLGYKITPEYLNEVVDGIKKDNSIASDAELVDQLRREGMTLSDLRRNIERSMLVRTVRGRELEGRVTVSEAEARADYEARTAEYTTRPSVNLQELRLPPTLAAADAQAREFVRRVRAGEDFTASAPPGATVSELGLVHLGDLAADLEATVFALPVGGVTDPLPAGEGIRVLRVAGKAEGSRTPFEQVKADITRRLSQARIAEAYETYMEGLRKAAMIQTSVQEVPLKVAVPATSILDAPTLEGAAAPTAPAADPDAEVVVSPQSAPERVVPPPPAPTPTPSPTPGPR